MGPRRLPAAERRVYRRPPATRDRPGRSPPTGPSRAHPRTRDILTDVAAPAPDAPTPGDLAALAERFAGIVGAKNVLTERTERRTYESDALTSHAVVPGLVVLPATPDEV